MTGRIRSIKPDTRKSERLARLSRDARLTYVYLWTLADDDGRFRAGPRYLLAELYPYDEDVDCSVLMSWIGELEASGRVRLYSVDGSHYGDIPRRGERHGWNHQRIDRHTPSPLPSFDEADAIGSPQRTEASRTFASEAASFDEPSASPRRALDEPSTSPRRAIDEPSRPTHARASKTGNGTRKGNGIKEGDREGDHGSFAPAVADAGRDLLFEAVAEVCGIVWRELTSAGRGPLVRAVRELRKVGASPDEVRQRAARWPYDAPLTPMGLTKHWAALGRPTSNGHRSEPARPSLVEWEPPAPPAEIVGPQQLRDLMPASLRRRLPATEAANEA